LFRKTSKYSVDKLENNLYNRQCLEKLLNDRRQNRWFSKIIVGTFYFRIFSNFVNRKIARGAAETAQYLEEVRI